VAAGIERINVYAGRAALSVPDLFRARGLDMRRFENLMMRRKSVNLPCEDPVSNAVNAAHPLIDALTAQERSDIELVVVGTESGLDFGKPISTYVHDVLGLPRSCRSFEVKHACYGGTAALHCAAALLAKGANPQAKALVVAADTAGAADRNTYWEPSQGAGAVAMIVGPDPQVLQIDTGASGYHSYEVMDTLRPRPDVEAGDSDLSLLSYLHCLEQSYAMYASRVDGADWFGTFDQLVFHAPFAGMVRGAHRTLSRTLTGAGIDDIEADFTRRVLPSLQYTMQVGNTYSASLYVGLCAMIDQVRPDEPLRAGMFSYGSGCASEFYSGVVPAGAAGRLLDMDVEACLRDRYDLAMAEYEVVSDLAVQRMAGVRDHELSVEPYAPVYEACLQGRGLLVLERISAFHREYRWS